MFRINEYMFLAWRNFLRTLARFLQFPSRHLRSSAAMMGKPKREVSKTSGSQEMSKKKAKTHVPDYAQLLDLRMGGNRSAPAAADQDIHIGVFFYASVGRVYAEVYGSSAMFVLIMRCQRTPNPLFKRGKAMELFGASAFEEDEETWTPRTLEDVTSPGRRRRTTTV